MRSVMLQLGEQKTCSWMTVLPVLYSPIGHATGTSLSHRSTGRGSCFLIVSSASDP